MATMSTGVSKTKPQSEEARRNLEREEKIRDQEEKRKRDASHDVGDTVKPTQATTQKRSEIIAKMFRGEMSNLFQVKLGQDGAARTTDFVEKGIIEYNTQLKEFAGKNESVKALWGIFTNNVDKEVKTPDGELAFVIVPGTEIVHNDQHASIALLEIVRQFYKGK